MQEKRDNFFQIQGFSIQKGQVWMSKPILPLNTKGTKKINIFLCTHHWLCIKYKIIIIVVFLIQKGR